MNPRWTLDLQGDVQSRTVRDKTALIGQCGRPYVSLRFSLYYVPNYVMFSSNILYRSVLVPFLNWKGCLVKLNVTISKWMNSQLSGLGNTGPSLWLGKNRSMTRDSPGPVDKSIGTVNTTVRRKAWKEMEKVKRKKDQEVRRDTAMLM